MARLRLTFLVVLLLAVGSAGAPISLGRYHTDESNGFKIQIPSKWDQVPTKFQDVALIGRWTGKAKRGRIIPELRVVRLLRVDPSGGEGEEPKTPAEAVEQGIPGYADLLRKQPKDIWAYVQDLLPRGMQVEEDDPDFRMKSKKYQAHLRVYKERGSDDRRAQQVRRLAVVAQITTIEPSDSIYGVCYFTSVADEKNMLRPFMTSVRRFKVVETDEDEELEEGESAVGDEGIFVNSADKPDEWREARKNKLKGVRGWDALDTQNYLIVYNKEVKRPLLKKIAKHIEAIRRDVYEQLFPPARRVKAISVVRVCKDRQEYHRYGGPGGSAGYWSARDEELVFYQDKNNKKDSLRVLYHEAFHQYIYYAVGDVAPHSWFNEGHGDYFAGHNYVGRKFVAKPFRWRTGIISNALARGSYVPLDKFLKYTQREYYANPGLCYAQGWSFIYFLREVEKKKIKKYEKYFGLLDRYFEAIKRNVKTVQENALEGLNEPKDGEGEKEKKKDEKPAPPPEPEKPKAPPGLPRLPGLDQPFPGEHPDAGAGVPEGEKPGEAERRTVAGPKITGQRSALDAAADEVFLNNRNIDIKQLEKDWVEWSK